MDLMKVSAKSNPNSVAGALAGCVRDHGKLEIQALGSGALYQSVKAIAIVRGFVASGGIGLVCIPTFQDVIINGCDSSQSG